MNSTDRGGVRHFTTFYELACAYSRFYEHCPVIQEDHLDVGRFKLSNLAGRTLSVGLNLLGIEALTEM